jgi:hypothetical protein
MPNVQYKSFCWSIGTTSFRTVDFNVQIERQLDLLNEFKSIPQNANVQWRELQLLYYRFMQERDFVSGDAPNPTKDAREKTSGLVAIGLIDNNRDLTAVGHSLLDISKCGNFKRNNPLQIPADSFIYLKQLLKTHVDVDSDIVRPFPIAVYVISKLGYLTNDEFTYLLPLCSNATNTENVISAIRALRKNIGSIDEIITSCLMDMDNYKSALKYFISQQVSVDVICAVGMNRKSGGSGNLKYDLPYYKFFKLLHTVVLKRDTKSVLPLLEHSAKIKGKAGVFWRKYIFKSIHSGKVKRDGLKALNDAPIFKIMTEREFRIAFFKLLHLFKAKATLADYSDLNERYFKTTDTIIFADGKVELDILPRCWFSEIADRLPEIAFSKCEQLQDDVLLEEIAPFLAIDERKLSADLERIFGIKITSASDVNAIIYGEKCKRFNKLIDERFNRTTLIDLFKKFEQREDNSIRQLVTNNADIPTIFEYILGIAWYLISDRCGDILSYMNLSLEADLLPRTHATGGNADIEYKYIQTDGYPAHGLLIEATLAADNSNQRRMEMEPVSRHLGEYILNTGDTNGYCVFVSTSLHRNVISDFRNRKTYQYFSDHYRNCVNGLKILPLATAEIRTILEHGINYASLYALFEAAYRSDEPVPTWYEREVAGKLIAQGDKVIMMNPAIYAARVMQEAMKGEAQKAGINSEEDVLKLIKEIREEENGQ